MVSSFRRLSKSKVGTVILVLFLVAIVASFALADISNITSGGFGGGRNNLARVGSVEITDRDLDGAMERRLAEVRQQNPEATYADLAGDFDQILASLVDEATLRAFADRHGFVVSKLLVDAEIASIPGTRGLDGRFSEQAYRAFLAQQRLSDAEVRRLISSGILQRLLIAPVGANARAPVGLARPYASMLLEQREGQVAFVPIAAFRAGLNPTPTDLQRYYAENQARYMIPEQRVLRIARIGPEQVANVTATDQEIAAHYQQNQAQYAPKEIRVISQAVVPDQGTAQAIAGRARGGQSFAAAAAPAGLSAADIAVGPQTRAEFSELAGEQVAAAAFGAAEGSIVGPVRSDLGWHVVKVDQIRREGGRPLSAVRGEIAARITEEKRKNALTDIVTKVEDEIAGGANFSEAAASARLAVVETPPVTANGTSVNDPNYRLPQDLAPALRSGFELGENDEPVVETLPNEAGYVLVAPARVIPSAPAPLASIRDRVANDWITAQARARAQSVASRIATAAGSAPLQQAVQGVPQAEVRPVSGQRIQLSQFQGQVPPPLAMLFSLGEGKARMVAGAQGEGFYVVKVNRIIPGNALNQPSIISQTQQQLQQILGEEYAQQFIGALRQAVDVRRNEKAIEAARKRLIGGS